MPTTGALPNNALDVVKPFAWLAAIAFLVGFCSYLVIGQPDTAFAHEGPSASTATVSGPSSDEWNLPKRI
jgi:hypothetical protein